MTSITFVALPAQNGQMLSTFRGHTDAVKSIVFSPDRQMFATASADRTVKLWDRALRQDEPLMLRGHSDSLYFAAFSPDGKMLATGGNDMQVKVWDTVSGREIRTLKVRTDAFSSAAFPPDGRLLATGGHDNRVRLWELAGGKELRTFEWHGHVVTAVAFSPDGKLLATGGGDHAVKLWEVTSGREVLTIDGFPKPVVAVAFARDGSTLTTFDGRDAKVWDVATGREVKAPCECHDLARSVWVEAFPELGSAIGIGVADHDPDRYRVPSSGSPALPPGGRTDVPRTLGWHKFQLQYEDRGLRMLIDDRQVAHVPGDYGFDEVQLSVSGPAWRRREGA